MERTKKPVKSRPAELRECAVRMVREDSADHASKGAAMRLMAEKVGHTPEHAAPLWVRIRRRGPELSLDAVEIAMFE